MSGAAAAVAALMVRKGFLAKKESKEDKNCPVCYKILKKCTCLNILYKK